MLPGLTLRDQNGTHPLKITAHAGLILSMSLTYLPNMAGRMRMV